MLHRVWKGEGSDTRMHHSSAPDNDHWLGEHPVERRPQEPVGLTSHGPALAVLNNTLHLVWKGIPGDPRMFHASSPDGLKWTGGGPPIPGTTSHRPALAVLGNRLHRVWKGDTDTGMHISGNSDGKETGWSGDQAIGGQTSHGPALAADPGGKLYRVFKGAGTDIRMHMSFSLDGGQIWTQDIPVSDVAGNPIGFTSDGPALAFLNNRLHLVWKGVPGDFNMFHASSTDGVKWTSKGLPIGGVTADGPALAAGPGGRLYRVWKNQTDNAIMISISTNIGADGTVDWTPADPIAGHTSNAPALVGF
jgi:hypothetical protein